jgi:pimeloyl-ACP methyl ester carboxylesterase
MTEIRVVGAGGEYMESVVVLEWLVQPGGAVERGQPVAIVETAKSATEIEAPASGILREIRAAVGAEIEIGGILGIIADTAGPAVQGAPARSRLKVSPAARRVASRDKIDLSSVSASSPSGRIKLRDLEAARQQPAAASSAGHLAVASERTAGSTLHMRTWPGLEGPKVVFLHGFGADSSSWSLLLARSRPAFGAVSIDLPSHGKSQATPARGLDALVRQVLAHLESERVTDVHLVGHSLGGGVAIGVAGTGRIRVRSLALLAPVGLGPEINSSILAGLARASSAETLAPWLRQMVSDESFVNDEFVRTTMHARGDPAMRDAQFAMARTIFPDDTQVVDYRSALASLDVPVKIIWGLDDRVITWRHALGHSGKEALHLLPGIGHLPHFEASALTGRLISELVRSAS